MTWQSKLRSRPQKKQTADFLNSLATKSKILIIIVVCRHRRRHCRHRRRRRRRHALLKYTLFCVSEAAVIL